MKTTLLTLALLLGCGSIVSAQTGRSAIIYNQGNYGNGRTLQYSQADHPAWYNGMQNSYFGGMYGKNPRSFVHINPNYNYMPEGVSRLGNPSGDFSLPVWGGLGQEATLPVCPKPIEPKVTINPFYRGGN